MNQNIQPKTRIHKTALISGASSGLGAEMARKFCLEGYDVILLGRDLEKLKKVQATLIQYSGQSACLAFDLNDLINNQTSSKNIKYDEIRHNILNQIQLFSPLSVLINNAGVYQRASFENTNEDIWYQQFNTNFLSAVKLTQLIWPEFIKQNKGSVLNISSSLGLKPVPMTSAYSAVKAAMVNWTQSLACEAGPLGIRVNCICPGIVDTPIHGLQNLETSDKQKTLNLFSSMQLLKEIGQPEDIAEAAYFLGSDLSKWTTGSILTVDGGISLK